jgi:hypothetical protein
LVHSTVFWRSFDIGDKKNGDFRVNTRYAYNKPFFSSGFDQPEKDYIVKTVDHDDNKGILVTFVVCRVEGKSCISVYVIKNNVTSNAKYGECKFAFGEFKFLIGNHERVIVKKRDMVSSKILPQIQMSLGSLGSLDEGLSSLLVSYKLDTRYNTEDMRSTWHEWPEM